MANINFSLTDEEKKELEVFYGASVEVIKKVNPGATLSFSAWLMQVLKRGLNPTR